MFAYECAMSNNGRYRILTDRGWYVPSLCDHVAWSTGIADLCSALFSLTVQMSVRRASLVSRSGNKLFELQERLAPHSCVEVNRANAASSDGVTAVGLACVNCRFAPQLIHAYIYNRIATMFGTSATETSMRPNRSPRPSLKWSHRKTLMRWKAGRQQLRRCDDMAIPS